MSHAERRASAGGWTAGEALESLSPLAVALGLCALAIALTLCLRAPIPVDETRYLTVAWDMWRSGDPLVLHLNGEPYAHKPPMLFWLINAAWLVTGPQEWSARLVPALFLPLSVFLTFRLGLCLGDRRVAGRGALVLASTSIFAFMGASTMFDAMLTSAVVLALIGLLRAARGEARSGWLIVALSLGFGVLAKGPVVLLHVLPAALLAPLWVEQPQSWRRWYLSLLAAVLGGAAIALAWAIPSALSGGSEFANELLWGQTSGRMVNAFAHRRPVWFYVALLPVLLFPWVFTARLWTRKVVGGLWQSRIWRLPVIMAAGSFVTLSLVSGKQIHYLLPMLPAASLIIARRLSQSGATRDERGFALMAALFGAALLALAALAPWLPATFPPIYAAPALLLIAAALPLWALRHALWQVVPAFAAILAIVLSLEAGMGALVAFDLRPLARQIDPARPLAFVGGYQGEVDFAARRTGRVDVVTQQEAASWRKAHPEGQLVAIFRDSAPDFGAGKPWIARYTNRYIGLWPPMAATGDAEGDAPPAGRR